MWRKIPGPRGASSADVRRHRGEQVSRGASHLLGLKWRRSTASLAARVVNRTGGYASAVRLWDGICRAASVASNAVCMASDVLWGAGISVEQHVGVGRFVYAGGVWVLLPCDEYFP